MRPLGSARSRLKGSTGAFPGRRRPWAPPVRG